MRIGYFIYTRPAFSLIISLFFYFLAKAQPVVSYKPLITSGLSGPMEVRSAPGDISGRLFIVEKGGTVKIWNGNTVLPTPFLNISSLISSDGEHGLLSMAFHPEYVTNGYFFLYYTNTAGDITVSRFKVSAGNPEIAMPDPDPALPLIQIPKPFSNHNGGHLHFRPESGINYLYFGTGDGGSGNDPNGNAQNPGSLLGKMIRIDVDAANIIPEIWSIGLRNPFRWSFDKSNGDMWIGDVGQSAIEEIDFLAGGVSGANFGWRCFEGTRQNNVTPLCDPPGKIPPVYEYDNPAEGRSVVGGYVYRGSEFNSLQGYYLATDFYTGTLWMIENTGTGFVVHSQPGMKQYVTSISEVEGDSLLIVSAPSVAGVSQGDTIFKIEALEVTPLHLTQFSGTEKQGYNELKWRTATEQNIDGFIIEYSTNGTDYRSAGEVKATNNASGSDYLFKHIVTDFSKLFYRLLINESDGKKYYSAVIILGNNSAGSIKVYPTVITNRILQVNSDLNIEKINIYTADGKQVFVKNVNNVNGYFSVPLPYLQKGIYIVRLISKGNEKNQRVIIQ